LFVELGGYPEEFGAYFEDVDFAFRLHWAGRRVVYEPRARVWHRVSASHGRRPTAALLAQQSCNEERVFWRNVPARMLWRALPWHLAVLLAKAWRRWRQGELLPFLRGRLRALAEWRKVLAHRRGLGKWAEGSGGADWCLEERFWGPSGAGKS